MALTLLPLRPHNVSCSSFSSDIQQQAGGGSKVTSLCRSVQLVYLGPSPTLSATTKPSSDQVRRHFVRAGSTLDFSSSQRPLRPSLALLVPCVGTMLPASTMASAPARAARDSSSELSRRTLNTSVWRTRAVRWTNDGGTGVSSAGSRSALLWGW